MKLLIAVLAGGQSRRMGRDKAWVQVDGVAMIERVVDAALHSGHDVAIIGKNQHQVSAQFTDAYPQVKLVADDTPHCGPLGALTTLYRVMPHYDAIALLPCDAPRMAADDVAWLCYQAEQYFATPEYQAVVPICDDIIQPLFAVYFRSAQATADQLFASSRTGHKGGSLRSLIETVRCKFVELPQCHRGAVQDVDTPEELQIANQASPPASKL